MFRAKRLFAALAFVAGSTLVAGCSGSMIGALPIVNAHAIDARAADNGLDSVSAASASTTPAIVPAADGLQRFLSDAERLAAEIAALRRELGYGLLGVLIVGTVNAALLAAILHALRASTIAATAAVTATPAAPVPAADERRCGCGATISAQSRTGRCRRCALEQRRTATMTAALRSR